MTEQIKVGTNGLLVLADLKRWLAIACYNNEVEKARIK